MHKALKFTIKYASVFIILYTVGIFALSTYFFLSDGVILDLNHDDLSFNLNFGDVREVNYLLKTNNNYFCNAMCEYEFFDLSEDKTISQGRFVLKPKETFNESFNISIQELGEGQKLYNYRVECKNIKTKICRTYEKSYSTNSFITVNFALNESTEALKNEVNENLINYLENLVKLDEEVQIIENRVYSLEEEVVFDEVKPELVDLTNEFNNQIINAENYKNEWSRKDYVQLAKIFDNDLRDIVISIDDLNVKSKNVIKKHNNVIIELNKTLQNEELVKETYRAGIFFNDNELIQNSLKIKGEIESEAKKLKSKQFQTYEEFDFSEINNILNYTKLIFNLEKKGQNNLLQNKSFEQSRRMCEYIGECNVSFDMCKLNDSMINESIENYLLSNITDVNINIYDGLKIEENKIIENINNVTSTLRIKDDVECFNLVKSFNLSNNVNYLKEIVNYMNETCLGNISISFKNLTMNNVSYDNIQNKSDINISLFLEEVKCEYPFANISFEINDSFEIVKEKKVNYNPKIDKNLSDNLPVCCVFGKCQPCCENCSNEDYPILFLHGHAFSEINSPEYSIGVFNQIQNSLQKEGYLNAGIITPLTKLSEVKPGEWGLSGHPVTVRATYYQNVIEIGNELVIIPKKDESIDVYSDRLKEYVDIIKLKTGKNKVILVTHSMGGLVARRYMQKYGENEIDKLIMVGTPNKGIDPAIERYCNILGNQKECSDMVSNGRFMSNLNRELPKIDQYVIYGSGCKMSYGDGDGVVLSENAKLESAKNIMINGSCSHGYEMHTDMLNINLYPEVREKIKEIISTS